VQAETTARAVRAVQHFAVHKHSPELNRGVEEIVEFNSSQRIWQRALEPRDGHCRCQRRFCEPLQCFNARKQVSEKRVCRVGLDHVAAVLREEVRRCDPFRGSTIPIQRVAARCRLKDPD
jgi:hypothetical protein